MPGEAVLKVLIVDDEPVARARMERLLARAGVPSVQSASDGVEAVAAIMRDRPDVVFLDVQMPGLDGFGVIERVGTHRMPVTVFVTAFEEHATRAFDAEALDYLLKPYEDSRFVAALERARRRVGEGRLRDMGAQFEALLALQRAGSPTLQRAGSAATNIGAGQDEMTVEASSGPLDRLVIRKDDRVRLLKSAEVDWFESAGVYARVHVGQESYLLRIPMHELEARLDAHVFVRVHRSAIVNIDRIKELRDTGRGEFAVMLHNGVRVRLSRTRRAALERRLGQSL